MRHTLLLALQEFPGAVVVVSHDRALLRGACDRFVLVADGALHAFDGDLEDYAAWLASAARRPPAAPRSRRRPRAAAAAPRGRGAQPAHAAAQRTAASRAQLQLAAAEQRELEPALSDPATYSSAAPDEQRTPGAPPRRAVREIAQLEERWLEVTTALEEAAS